MTARAAARPTGGLTTWAAVVALVLSLVTGCGIGPDRVEEGRADEGRGDEGGGGAPAPVVGRGTGPCPDASPDFHPADDRSRAVVRNGDDDAWIIDPDGSSEPVDLDGVADPYSLFVGGDRRLWSVDDQGGVTATDLSSGATGRTALPVSAPSALGVATDGIVIVSAGLATWLGGTPITARSVAVPELAEPVGAQGAADGTVWVSTRTEGAGLVSIGPDGAVSAYDLGEATGPKVFPGDGCAVALLGGCPSMVLLTFAAGEPAPVGRAETDGGCGLTVDIHAGVAWSAEGGTLTRVDLGTGASTSADGFADCGDGMSVFAGPGGVAVTDDCDIVLASADPATGAMTELRELEGEVEDGMDALAIGSWPWVGFEDHLFHLPALDEVDHGLPSTPGPYGFEVVAVIPPPAVP